MNSSIVRMGLDAGTTSTVGSAEKSAIGVSISGV
jgi:hypothetical protein